MLKVKLLLLQGEEMILKKKVLAKFLHQAAQETHASDEKIIGKVSLYVAYAEITFYLCL